MEGQTYKTYILIYKGIYFSYFPFSGDEIIYNDWRVEEMSSSIDIQMQNKHNSENEAE